MAAMSENERLARWGAVQHGLGETEQRIRRMYDTLKRLHVHEDSKVRPAVEMATANVREAHARLCEAIHTLNAVAPKPSEQPPHKPAGEL